jgi:hypothetical protein
VDAAFSFLLAGILRAEAEYIHASDFDAARVEVNNGNGMGRHGGAADAYIHLFL